MAKIYVQIVSCSGDQAWYNGMIGHIKRVDNSWDYYYHIRPRRRHGPYLVIDKKEAIKINPTLPQKIFVFFGVTFLYTN